jgi:PAS domain S-box-containing protein
MNDRHDQKEQPNKGLEREIAERKRVERALRESEQLYSSLFKNNHSVMLLIDPESADIVDANPAACSFYGWSQEELTSMKITDINMLPNEQVFQEIERAKSEARYHFFFRHCLANEEIRDVEVYSGPIRLHGKELLYSIIHDISERKRAEQEKKKLEGQLLQTKKLEAISTLSGGVAQELSNLFQAVHGYVERLMWGKEQDDPRYQELLEITNAAFRGAVLSRRLLAFSGIIESKKQPIDLNQEIKKVHKLLMRTMPETIELELHLANEITIINGDPNQIEQALLALAVNARDAMPGGGKIIIETKRMILDDDFLRTHAGAAMGECVLITLSDTGPGLGQETLEHVFDPFYSKEYNSEKTGLGLSMVYGIVKNHGGYISCSSEPEVGTTFMIYLPVTEKDAEID